MSKVSLSGLKTLAIKATRGIEIVGDGSSVLTQPNTWYEISAVAGATAFPIDQVSAVFRSPDTSATQITLADGDKAYPLTLKQIAKTDAEITCEEGTIDVTDDMENGFNAYILDGYKDISGSLNGFLKFDDETGELEDSVAELLGRFFNVINDDGEGTYDVTAAENEAFLLFICLNKNAAVGAVQNWIILSVLLSSLGTGAGLKDAQKRDLSWKKAQGYTSQYRRTVFAGDTIDKMIA
jgi:hypothetical protein